MCHAFHFAKKSVLAILTVLGCFISISYADSAPSSSYPVLAGGINPANFQACISLLTSRCMRTNRDLPYPIYPLDCLNKYFVQPVCVQTVPLYQFTGLLPTEIKRYGTIDLFSVTRYADGINNTYMIDNSGRIIPLTDAFDLRSLKNSAALLAQSPTAIASSISTGTPVYLILPDGSQHLIFLQQILLDGTYASRTDSWQVQVDYAFSTAGDYKAAQPLALVHK
ncbi:MAG: hypothetical protein K0R12_313 [Gammaproteobacteria bacterium]|nr:hypothetical protein [Gammaproteobacteria bacterium]